MKRIEVKKVETKKEWDDFISLPRRIYNETDGYVHDLDVDVRETLNPKNPVAEGVYETQAFVAYKEGKVAGRIVGIINHNSNSIWKKKSVRFGYIEFIDDKEVSEALLNAVSDWGKEKGMKEIEGPLGITDYDKEGMLIEDFDAQGTMIDIWNHPYYPEHMEAHGFGKAADWVHIRIDVPEEVPARYARVAKYAKEEFKLHIAKRTKKEVMGEYGVKQVFKVLNAAFAPLFDFAPFTDEQAAEYLKKYVPLLNLDFVVLIENEDNELVGIAVTIADFSEGMRKSKGRLFPTGWWHLLKALKFKKHDTALLMLIGVLPELQGMGINALVFDQLIPVYNKYGIKHCETGPQLEDNVKELSQWKVLKPQTLKRRRCWEKGL